jgi:hypothetical protein
VAAIFPASSRWAVPLMIFMGGVDCSQRDGIGNTLRF